MYSAAAEAREALERVQQQVALETNADGVLSLGVHDKWDSFARPTRFGRIA